MRKVKLYIAISLDGKIAKPDGDVKWLDEIPNPEMSDYGYVDFINNIDITLMGRNTYDFVVNSGVPFPYTETENYVFSRDASLKDNENVKVIHGDPAKFVAELKEKDGKDIWLIGGGKINTILWNKGLIDELMVFVMPIVLGDGIPLFGHYPITSQLKLTQSIAYSSGVCCLCYKHESA